RKFEQGIYFLVGALELLLGLRFILRLSAANTSNTFAGVIYGLSEPFVRPFSTLFISPTFNGSANIFDINLLIAMIAYLVLMFLVVWLVRIISTN
ncbi:MAG: YggT family protein, partial [Cyanobacteria bacterium J06639_16]